MDVTACFLFCFVLFFLFLSSFYGVGTCPNNIIFYNYRPSHIGQVHH